MHSVTVLLSGQGNLGTHANENAEANEVLLETSIQMGISARPWVQRSSRYATPVETGLILHFCVIVLISRRKEGGMGNSIFLIRMEGRFQIEGKGGDRRSSICGGLDLG